MADNQITVSATQNVAWESESGSSTAAIMELVSLNSGDGSGNPVDGNGLITVAAGADLTVNSSCVIRANGTGFPRDSGIGKGASGTGHGGGAGHGGVGGAGSQPGGTYYGSATAPVTLGSGGGDGYMNDNAGNGGGAIRLDVSGTLTVNGAVAANGTNGWAGGYRTYAGGGGSGGSIYATCGTLAGTTGSFQANGGNGGAGAGGGAGGRFVIYRATSIYTGTTTVTGGTGANSGGTGSNTSTAHTLSRPSNTSPVEGEATDTLTPLLSSSAFSDSLHTHYSSQWRLELSTARTVFEGENQSQQAGLNGTNVADAAAYNGTALQVTAASATGNGLIYGPYSAFCSNGTSYRAVFRMKVASNASSSNICYIDINESGGVGLLSGPRYISANEFTAGNTYQDFTIDFIKGSAGTIETRVFFYDGVTDLTLDRITVAAHYGSWDSGEDRDNKTSVTVPSGILLSLDMSWYWRVRHKDSIGNWSAWSGDTVFEEASPRSPAIAPSGGGGLIF
jgi:hypothetical protein